ncbi:methyl-accepting chemotaxis protein [Duganella sp. BJB488]|uniref:methyl-accepting chemotaxis protein n=1 Tax=unclassified Duganella TaxID=2636909 RepID=UPI000E3518C6|nr:MULTISPECIES: methyl-accepting chemotaxis protein [unclassified Duganella]NVD69984.1 MCP four helix bundle domain-containing protein [Duganella sp. BJB1802]RFP12226.1 methyl-accepting chemotaxis protein [Duganella sp. BJB488]RFP20128.1 methyl-accepting chemotaxis protein [Duganella sp. BJB489]RFP33565.1 methyl-accepting chemotaxis protein [Duganella sp. BJB480]
MKFQNWTIASRLGLGFGLCAVFLLVIIALALNSMRQIQGRLDEITKINDVETKLAQTMDLTVTERALATRNLILLKEDKEIQIEVTRIGEQEKKYAAAQDQLGQMFTKLAGTSNEEKELLDQIRKQADQATPFVQRAAALALEQKQDEAYKLLRYEFRPVQKRWWELLRKLIAVEEKQNVEASEAAEVAYGQARTVMLVMGSLALVTSVLAAWLITRGVTRQLGCEPSEAAEIAGQIAAGNLTVRVEPKHGDESSLLYAMRSMRDSLARIVNQVHASTETIAAAAGQIASGNLDLSSRTEQQASTLEETASSMEELTSTVRLNTDHARQANGLAESASDVAAKGGAVVAQVVDTMAAIDVSARKIVDIIAVIDGIAFQTNILALNAAVEAARAGEQGRGFAVVATEVRNLAQRSAAAAKEIKDLIGDSVDKVQAGNRLVEQAGTTMHDVVSSVKRVTDIMSEIMLASQEQSSGIEQINTAVTQMDDVTQQNAALVEEAAAAAHAMQDQVNSLNELVSVFRTEAPAARPALQRVAVAVPSAMRAPALTAAARPRGPAKVDTQEWEQF